MVREPPMSDRAGSAALRDSGDAVSQTLLARKVQMHRGNMRMTHLVSLGTALLLALMLRGAVPDRALLAWLALLVALFIARTLVARFPPRADDGVALNRGWLRRVRICFLAHGLAWGLCSALPMHANDPLHLAVMVVVV